jgi:mRNA-degrading endonuclease RelE of RelBE toxin-antitoxin system
VNGRELYELRVTGPAQRQLEQLPANVAAAVVEFMMSTLLERPHQVGGRLQRELEELHSARRGAYRIVYRIDDEMRTVTVLRVDHRARVYRLR